MIPIAPGFFNFRPVDPVQDHPACLSAMPYTTGSATLSFNDSPNVADFDLSFYFRYTAGDSTLYCELKTGTSLDANTDGLILRFNKTSVELKSTLLGLIYTGAAINSGWNLWRIAVSGTSVQVYLNDVVWKSTTLTKPLGAGRFRMAATSTSGYGRVLRFDDINMTSGSGNWSEDFSSFNVTTQLTVTGSWDTSGPDPDPFIRSDDGT